MRLWGIPFPVMWSLTEALEVIVPSDAASPRTARVKGRRLARSRADTWILQGLPVVDPVAALFTCAAELTVAQAVAAIDALITTSSAYPGLGPGRPMASTGEIVDRLESWGRFPGSGTIKTAVPLARERVESPKETETRLMIVAAGLPEPVVQWEVRSEGRSSLALTWRTPS